MLELAMILICILGAMTNHRIGKLEKKLSKTAPNIHLSFDKVLTIKDIDKMIKDIKSKVNVDNFSFDLDK